MKCTVGKVYGDHPMEHNVFIHLARTAHRGFVRHLPLLGPLSDEADALLFVLNSSPESQVELALSEQFRDVRDLPSLQIIYEDIGILDQLDSIGSGNLLHLFDLLRNPKIVAFFEEEAVHQLIDETRPSLIAEQLKRIEEDRRSEPRSP